MTSLTHTCIRYFYKVHTDLHRNTEWLFYLLAFSVLILIKTRGRQSQGQETACTCIFKPMLSLQCCLHITRALKFVNAKQP